MTFDDDETIGKRQKDIIERQVELQKSLKRLRFSYLIIGAVIGWLSCRVIAFVTELQP